MKPTILVTGGAGFIGTHLCQALAARGASVRCLDLRLPEHRVSGVEYLRADVREREAWEPALRSVSAVFHLAAVANVSRCEEDPRRAWETNFLSTVELLEAITAGPRARLIFPSSAAVYGSAGETVERLRERQIVLKPLSRYGFQKLQSERALRFYHRAFGLETISLRLFNVFGPGQSPDSRYASVMIRFREALAAGEPILLHGGGEQTRDFVYVGDVVEACLRALRLESRRCRGQAINIGSGQGISIRALAEHFCQKLGVKVPLQSAPPRAGDIAHSTADIARAERLLAWHPTMTLHHDIVELLQPTARRAAA